MALRQPILYAQELWRRQRTWVFMLLILGVVFAGAALFYPPVRTGGSSNWIFFVYIPFGLVFGAGLLYYRWRSQVEVHDEGLVIGTLTRRVFIEWELVRLVRVQPLDRHFQGSRVRLTRQFARTSRSRDARSENMLTKPAVYIRLKGDEGRMLYISKKLGQRYYFDDTIALPVPDPNALSWEISSHLPERVGTNQGGQRRRRRGK